ncbi:MAG: stimulus-sensing domain-containing protein [Stappiaceae bacterium]
MAVEHLEDEQAAGAEGAPAKLGKSGRRRLRRRVLSRLNGFGQSIGTYVFSSLTRRIVVLNLAALLALVIGILYLNQFRAGLIDARVASLLTQGEIIAGAIAASASADTDAVMVDPEKLLQLRAGESATPYEDNQALLDFPINPERIAPLLRRLISPTKTRARIYDSEGILLLDSRHLYSQGEVLRFDLPPPTTEEPGYFETAWQNLKLWSRRGELPLYEEQGPGNGRAYPEVEAALAGSPASIVRVSEKGELIVSVAVPVQRFRAVLGTLLLSTQGGDIDAIVSAERVAIFRVFIVAAAVTVVMSTILAGTIAGPMRRLASAADRVRRGVKTREEIPGFSDRQDEIGHLARALRDMTNALYDRLEAIERFAADVSHELKNPLTSLRSAVETLPLAKSEESRDRLLEIVLHDVRRLDRLISDISDASRLDAELARSDLEPVNISALLDAVVEIANQTWAAEGARIELTIEKSNEPAAYFVLGHDSRLGQVISNLIDNAHSFCPEAGQVRVAAIRRKNVITITVDDDGPGIQAERVDRIFERFYTDRPEGEAFGNNSGLGLSISRQIIEAHNGSIWALNRTRHEHSGEEIIEGARFVVELPAAQKNGSS